MPPKELFTPKLFIKSIDKPEAEWKELVGQIVSDSITITEDAPNPYRPTTLNFAATVKICRKNIIRLFKAFGVMKRPRLTYRTIRQHCAKRNK